MANPSTRGFFFERIAITSNLFEDIQDQLVSLTLSDNQFVDFVKTMTSDHKPAGVVRGNSEGRAVISIYNRTNTSILDLRGYDFDGQPVDIQLIMPSTQYGDNAFANSVQYINLKQVYLAEQAPLSAGGVGSPVAASYNFLVSDYEIVMINNGQV